MVTETKERRSLDAGEDENGDGELEDLDGRGAVEAGDGDVDLGSEEEAVVGDEDLGCAVNPRGDERTLAICGAHSDWNCRARWPSP
jgi:hypothetical protein